jgi:hypothetical protein
MGITRTSTWFTRRTAAALDRPLRVRASTLSISASRRCAFTHEIGSDGMRGPLLPAVRLLSGYAGRPGVEGSPAAGMYVRSCNVSGRVIYERYKLM